MTDCFYVFPCHPYEEVTSGDHASSAHMMITPPDEDNLWIKSRSCRAVYFLTWIPDIEFRRDFQKYCTERHRKIDRENGRLMSYVSRLWLTTRFKVDHHSSGMTGSIPTYCYLDTWTLSNRAEYKNKCTKYDQYDHEVLGKVLLSLRFVNKAAALDNLILPERRFKNHIDIVTSSSSDK